MQTLPKPRLRRLNIRLSQQEWDRVKNLSSHTTCRSVSEYSRKLLLDKPVRVFYRNQSFDDFEQRMIGLQTGLEDFGGQFDQLVKKLSLQAADAEIRTLLPLILASHQAFTRMTEEIKDAISKIADQCAPK